MATAALISLDEYLHTTYSPDREWLDGEMRERSVGEGSHANVQTFFIKYFGAREDALGVRVTQELRTQVSATHFRIPDVIVMRASDPFEEIVTVAPLLCIEVLSPDDRMIDMQDKIEDYLQMGVAAVWVINPLRRSASMVERRALVPVEELIVAGTEIRIPVATVFAELNRLQGKSSMI